MTTATLYKLCKALCISSDFILFGMGNENFRIIEMVKSLSAEQQKNAEELLNVFILAINQK